MGSIGLKVEQQPEYEEIPAGTYDANVTNSMWAVSHAGNDMVSVEFTLTSGHPGRKIFSHFLLNNSDPKLAETARSKANRLCNAVGIIDWEEPEELLGNLAHCCALGDA